jgi:hypothetical protein
MSLQFAHIKDTGLNGIGRGRKERYYDIRNHPDSYALLCEDHHKAYDAGVLPESEFLEVGKWK